MPAGFDGISDRIKKAWRMKPKQRAGNSTTKPGGRAGEAKTKPRQQKQPKKEK
jgi:hypothetical protein